MERDNLQKTISEVERVLVSSAPGTRFLLLSFLENAKGRVAVLDKKITETQVERESRAREQASVASLAQKEAALSASEKQTYSGFLAKDFFTKENFGSLEKFYAQTWDRLSERGKDQMSHRIWEGVRRDEYKFSELPKVVQEKETERAYYVLKKRETGTGKASHIPETDREDFIRAYESGKREEAKKILERESFRMNMFVNEATVERRDVAASHGRGSDDSRVVKNTGVNSPQDEKRMEPVSGDKSDLDLSGLNLDGVKLADAPPKISSTDIPAAVASSSKTGQSLGNG